MCSWLVFILEIESHHAALAQDSLCRSRSKWISVSGQPGLHGEIPTLKWRNFDSNLSPWYVVFITLFSYYHVSVTSMVSGTLRLSVSSSLYCSAHFHIPPNEGSALLPKLLCGWMGKR